jgi:methylmalonyl-CoA epimerase
MSRSRETPRVKEDSNNSPTHTTDEAIPSGLSHIGIAVHRIDDVLPLFVDLLGASFEGRQTLEDRGLDVAFVRLGSVEFELLEARRPGTAIEKFLATRGPGLHHLALTVGDVAAALVRLRTAGLRLIDDEPRPGAHGDVAFVHPSSTHGVLIELCASEDSRSDKE